MNITLDQEIEIRRLSDADARHANSRALYMRLEAAAVAERKRLDDAKAARIAAAESERKALFEAGQQPPLMGSRSSVSDITSAYMKR